MNGYEIALITIHYLYNLMMFVNIDKNFILIVSKNTFNCSGSWGPITWWQHCCYVPIPWNQMAVKVKLVTGHLSVF